MDVLQGIWKAAQPQLAQKVVRKGLPDFRKAAGKGKALNLAHHFPCDARVLELFGARIDARQAALGEGALLGCVHFGVDHIPASTKLGRFAEEKESGTGNKALPIPFDAFEEDHLHTPCGVFHHHAQAFGRAPVDALPAGVYD